MTRIRLNVSGTLFEFDSKILRNYQGQKLAELCADVTEKGTDIDNKESGGKNEGKDTIHVDKEGMTVFVERPAKSFAAILSFYQTGELHIPLDVCPGSFQQEMNFWKVDPSDLTECCSYRLGSFLDETDTRRSFMHETRNSQHSSTDSSSSGLQYIRWRIWSVIDYHENTLQAKVYFVFISSLVLISIISLAMSTESSMRRRLTKCEILEFLEHSEHAEAVHVADEWEDLDCSNPNFDVDDYDYLHDIFEDGGAVFYDDYLGENITISLPDMTVPVRAFFYLDMIILAMFTGDVLLRLFSWPSIVKYFLSIVNIVDFLAIVTSYTYLILVNVEREHRYAQSWLHILNYFQVFRSLRLLRIVKNVRASQVLAYSLRQNIKDIAVLLLFLFFGVSTFACIIYFAENRKIIRSIPEGWYFSIITLTTVGYGDITPKSSVGAVVASLCAVMGIVLLAVTVPIFVNNFLTLYQYAVIDEFTKQRSALETGQSSDGLSRSNGEKTQSDGGQKQSNQEFSRKRRNTVSVINVNEAPISEIETNETKA